ncbi:alpha/beta hydrolase [Nocardia sp. NPDC050378]|uniref:alpha/beta fold hydrolase n=1 Tax=Nocardia sp. NPDC050378 TaxID=3155400 RepID=UPI0033CAE897
MHNADYLEIDGRLGYVEIAGDGDDTLLCVHTAGQSGVQYRKDIEGLAALGFRVVVVDLPGHGRSEPAVDGPITSIPYYGEWCLKVLDRLAVGDRYVLGCSIGGRIALEMASRASDSLAGVVAMECPVPRGGGPWYRPPEDSGTPSVRDQTYYSNRALIGSAVPAETAEMIATMHCREDWHVTRSDLVGWGKHDLWERLPDISCPTYVIAGGDSFGESMRSTADRIPGALFHSIEGIAHYPNQEMPDFVDAFKGWLEELRATAASGKGGR